MLVGRSVCGRGGAANSTLFMKIFNVKRSEIGRGIQLDVRVVVLRGSLNYFEFANMKHMMLSRNIFRKLTNIESTIDGSVSVCLFVCLFVCLCVFVFVCLSRSTSQNLGHRGSCNLHATYVFRRGL